MRSRRLTLRVLAVLCVVVLTASGAVAERLPIRTYSSEDGLGHDRVKRIVRDPRGFLWFCTPDGLSRFDGYRFTTYGPDVGLPHSSNDLLVARDGTYWIATNGGGVARLRDVREAAVDRRAPGAPDPKFSLYSVGSSLRTNRVNVLLEDRAGRLWAGTDGGLFELDKSRAPVAFREVPLALIPGPGDTTVIFGLLEDRDGSMWIGTTRGLVRRLPDGKIVRCSSEDPRRSIAVTALLQDASGRLWVGHRRGLVVFVPEPAEASGGATRDPSRELSRPSVIAQPKDPVRLPDAPGEARWFDVGDVRALYRASDGRTWIGTTQGLLEFNGSFRRYTRLHGLVDDSVASINEDRDGNLWLGSYASGAMRITRNGLISYDKADGLPDGQISSLFETRAGEFCAVSRDPLINRFDGRGFVPVRPNLPQDLSSGDADRQVLEDHLGEWWVPTSGGLHRFPAVQTVEALAKVDPKRTYTSRDGLPGNDVRQLFEDSRGDLWIGTTGPKGRALSRWERATDRFHSYVEPAGSADLGAVAAFAEDTTGSLWIAFRDAGLARYRGGRFIIFGSSDGVPAGSIRGLHLDRGGRLWLVWLAGTDGGMSLLEHPEAERPRFVRYITAEGLATSQPACVAEDNLGRIYVGTTRGVERIDPATGRVKHFTTADGLSHMEVLSAYRDRSGALWFGTTHGLSRFVPGPETPASPPIVAIGGLRIAGTAHSLSELGETEIAHLELEPDEGQIQIDFFGLGFAPGERLRYQFKLEGADRDWSKPGEQRSVNYAHLSAGSYRFLVRAINTDGLMSPRPAAVAFTVLPHIWARWWFFVLAAALLALLVHTFYRTRLRRLLELERVRTRIAADLHDDVGSSLSRIAIMSEVLHRQVRDQDGNLAEPLSLIAASSRESVDSIGDIVWAIDPRRDSVQQLSQRMRRFASDLLTANDVRLDFRSPESDGAIPLGAEIRRELFLIFKESVHNVARHSGCGHASVILELRDGCVFLEVRDDGKGLEADAGDKGLGLRSMRERAEKLGGQLRVVSPPEGGTSVRLTVPIARHRVGRRTSPPE